MKFHTLNVRDFGGVRTAVINLSAAPVTLIAGHNYSGKSCLANAIKLALTGLPERIKLKKDYGLLVREGATDGSIRLSDVEGKIYSMDLPKGAWSEREIPDELFPLLVDMQGFAALPAKQKHKAVCLATRTSMSPDGVARRLIQLGCNDQYVESIKGLFEIDDIETAYAAIQQKLTQKRAEWGNLTGTKYGSKKAEKPIIANEMYSEEREAQLRKDLDQLYAEQTRARAELQSFEESFRAAKAASENMASLRELSAKLPRLLKKLETDEAELARCTQQYEATRKLADPKTPDLYPCPCCGKALYIENGKLQAYSYAPLVPDQAAISRLPDHLKAVELMRRTVEKDRELVAEARDADRQVTANVGGHDLSPTLANIDGLRVRLNAIKADIARAESDVVAQVKINEDFRLATTINGIAAEVHLEICEWTKIAECLEPGGIMSDLIGSALKILNDRLDQSAQDTGWPKVVIDPDMNITAGGRLYCLLSESEKWRTDAMITEALSFVSGNNFMVLDRMDLLVPHARGELMGWLDVLADAGEIHTAVICASLKEPPGALPNTMQVVWMADGQPQQFNTIEQAA